MEVCTGCGIRTDRFVKYKCPDCGEVLVRCYHCRSIGKKYKCPKCEFEGP